MPSVAAAYPYIDDAISSTDMKSQLQTPVASATMSASWIAVQSPALPSPTSVGKLPSMVTRVRLAPLPTHTSPVSTRSLVGPNVRVGASDGRGVSRSSHTHSTEAAQSRSFHCASPPESVAQSSPSPSSS